MNLKPAATRAGTILGYAVIQTSTMFASAIILFAAAEGVNWFMCWRQARREGR